MTFANPLVLLGLVPVGALLLYLLVGKRRRVDVPFVELWRGPVEAVKTKRAWRLPPVAVMLALAAVTAGVVAGAGPEIDSRVHLEQFTIVVDRGVTASAKGSRGYRFHQWAETAGPLIAQKLGPGPVKLAVVPGDAQNTDTSEWAGLVRQMPASNVKTGDLVREAVVSALRETRGPVIVLSDQAVEVNDERVLVLSPGDALNNAGLVRVAVRERPAAQLMARVRNQGAATSAVIRVTGVGVTESAVTLPAAGEQDYFVDLLSAGDRVKVELVFADDLAADNVAWVVRQQGSRRVEARGPVPAELARLIERYNELKRGREDGTRVSVYAEGQTAPLEEAAIFVASAQAMQAEGAAVEVEVEAHPAIAGVSNLPAALGKVTVGAVPADLASWKVIVQVGGQPAVAVRQGAARQAWVGFSSDEFAATAQSVVFWAGLFDWVGGAAGTEFTASALEELTDQWMAVEKFGEALPAPGVYRQGEMLRAFNLLDVKAPEPRQVDWGLALERARRGVIEEKRGVGLGSIISLAALALLAAAALAWSRQAEEPARAPRHGMGSIKSGAGGVGGQA